MSIRNWFSLMVAVVLFATCQASAMVFDDFNDGLLDPAWNVVFDNATGWTYQESGTKLNVTAIGGTHPGVDEWNTIRLQQNFIATGDFESKCAFSWDSEGSIQTMQNFFVTLYSEDESVASGCGYFDAWLARSGEKVARIGDDSYHSGWDTLPLAGDVEIIIKRTSNQMSVLWNNDVLLTGFSDVVIDKVELQFGGTTYPGANFGVLSVDYVNAVPEPATMLLFGIGSCCALSRRRRV